MSETTRAPVDVFEKARNHDRREQLEAAQQADLLPYFRLMDSQAGPIVEMEGRETIMLGSNNYLGLTGDPRVKDAARAALDRYGTGLTGSRFLNGTLDLHLELERELADWMGTEDVLVYTTGYLANTGAIGTLLDPGDTVICDFTAATHPTGATNADAPTGPTVASATNLTVAAVGTGTITIH